MPITATPASPDTDAALQHDIAALRARFPRTHELYREVCALLFFRYGVTPTANKLYQLVRKGSMSAPAEALAQFWAELREKSRTRIDHPELPEALGEAAGHLVAQLWQAAQQAAADSLAAFRHEAEQDVSAARQAAMAATAERQAEAAEHARQCAALQDAVAAGQAQHAALREHLATLERSRDTLASALSAEKAEKVALQASLEDQRREFARELEGLRTAMQLADERARAAERRWLLELDRERTHAGKLQKQLEQLQLAHQHEGQRQQQAHAALRHELTTQQQAYLMLEHELQQARAQTASQQAELQQLHLALAQATAQAQALRRARTPPTKAPGDRRKPRRRAAARRHVQDAFGDPDAG